jgi:hypothetical protein
MTKQPKRIQVRETERYCESYFEDSLENIISELQSKLDEGWEGIEMGSDQWTQDHEVFYLYKHRPENDTEYEKRMKQLDKEKQVKDAAKIVSKEHRRKEYERLKKEFEDTP